MAHHSHFSALIPIDDQRPIAKFEFGAPVIATTEGGFFAVWAGGARGARISSSGEILDFGGISLMDTYLRLSSPAIASDEHNCFVVFQASWFDNWIYGVRIVDGHPMNPFLITTNGMDPSVAWSGSEYLVTWRNDNALMQRFSRDGQAIDPEPIIIHQTGGYVWNLKVGGASGRFLIAWTHLRPDGDSVNADVFGLYLNDADALSGSDSFPITATAYQESLNSIVSRNGALFILWNTEDRLYGRVIDGSGALGETTGLADGFNASAAPIPAGYLVVYETPIRSVVGDVEDETRKNISALVVSPSGLPLTPEIEIANADGPDVLPQVASNGTNCFAVWFGARSWQAGAIKGTPISSNGEVAVVNGYPVANKHAPQRTPAVACNGRNFFVAWNDQRNYPDSTTVLGTRLSLNGAPLDAVPIEIGGGANPSVAACGKNYLVVFDVGGYMGRRMINTEGHFVEPVIVDPSAEWAGGRPVVAGGDEGFLVASVHYVRRTYPYVEPMRSVLGVMRLNRAGQPIESQLIVNPGAGSTLWPAAAARGSDYLLTWSESPGSMEQFGQHFLKGILITSNGYHTAIDFNAQLPGGLQEPNNQIAATSSRYIVTWVDNNSATGQLHAIFLDRQAQRMNHEITLTAADARAAQPTIPVVKNNFLVAWTEQYGTSNSVVVTACISETGRVQPLGVVDSSIGKFDYARLATDRRNRALFVTQHYQQQDESGIFGAPWKW